MKALSKAMELSEFPGKNSLRDLFSITNCGGEPNFEPLAKRMTDDQLVGPWPAFVIPWIKYHRPDFFKANAGVYEYPKVKTDKAGHVLDRRGRPLRKAVKKDKDGNVISWSLVGEPARSTDNYDEADWMAHLRLRFQDWADAILALADIIRSTCEDANGNSPLTERERQVFEVIQSLPLGKGLTADKIVAALATKGIVIHRSTLTRHIIPVLKARFGLRNRRNVGYYFPKSA
jgi:hypothetical protein